jgi:Protein of unknown function (DUF3303)
MKYVVTWWEQPQGSPEAYEAAQKRVMAIFSKWQMPDSLKIYQFVTRVGSWGGYLVVETDNIADIQKLSTAFATFGVRVEPVMDIMDAVAAEMEAMSWRDGISVDP